MVSWHCAQRSSAVECPLALVFRIKNKAKATYTTDPNTKSQSCVHDCRPNPNP